MQLSLNLYQLSQISWQKFLKIWSIINFDIPFYISVLRFTLSFATRWVIYFYFCYHKFYFSFFYSNLFFCQTCGQFFFSLFYYFFFFSKQASLFTSLANYQTTTEEEILQHFNNATFLKLCFLVVPWSIGQRKYKKKKRRKQGNEASTTMCCMHFFSIFTKWLKYL